MDYLAERKLIVTSTRISPIGNALVLITPVDSAITAVDLQPGVQLPSLLGNRRLTTGDPHHVPVGRYAQQALAALAFGRRWNPALPAPTASAHWRWSNGVKRRLASSTQPMPRKRRRSALSAPFLSTESHAPIRQHPMAIVTAADGPSSRALFAFLTGDEAKAVYRKYGFTINFKLIT